ncbi:MAG TPA: DNA polymerase III subunit delta [Candidatus Latescibacteria bacterium]|nr:DNA polymerase III subunit delta [Candidatus Latescibacterota bacterium]
MTVREFREKVRSRGPLAGYFLVGEAFQREEALHVLLDFLVPSEARDLDLEVFWGEEVDPSKFSSSLYALPMRAGRKVLLVRSCEGMGREVWRKLSTALSALPPSACAIFSGEKVDRRLLPDEVLRESFWAEFGPLRGRRLMGWLAERARRLDKELSREAAELLVAYLGEDLWALAGELEKLSSYVGERRRIECKDVQEAAGAWAVQVFKLTDAVGAGDVGRAMAFLHQVLEAGESANVVLALLRRHWKVLAKLALLRQGRKPESRLAAEVGVPQYFLGRYLQQAEGRSGGELAKEVEAILRAEHRLRSGGGDARTVLSLLLWELCGGGRWEGL